MFQDLIGSKKALAAALVEASFNAMTAWNLDETSVSTVTWHLRVLPQRGEHQASEIASAKGGVTFNMCVCVETLADRALAPALIFPWMRLQEHLGTRLLLDPLS